MENRIGTILCSWNFALETIEALKSFEHCKYEYLVIIDNASKKKDKEMLERYLWHEYKKHSYFVDLEKEVCLSKSLNIGIQNLINFGVDFVGWWHADMRFPDPLWLQKLRAFLQINPDIAKVAPITTAHGKDYDKKPTNKFVRGNSCPWLVNIKAIHEVRRKYGNAFDEDYLQLDYEDWDFNNRLVTLGYNVAIWEGTRVKHDGAGYKFKPEMIKYYGKVRKNNFEIYKKKWGIDHPLI